MSFTEYFSSTGHVPITAFVFAAVISGLLISTVFADGNHGHGQAGHNGQHGNYGNHGNHRRNHYRHNDHRDYRYGYGYAQPVYVPAPVYYEPQPSPGISLFFPIDIRR